MTKSLIANITSEKIFAPGFQRNVLSDFQLFVYSSTGYLKPPKINPVRKQAFFFAFKRKTNGSLITKACVLITWKIATNC